MSAPPANSLASLKPGSSAVIKGFFSDDNAFMRFRELGLLPGTTIKVIRRAPLGDPIEISVRGSLLSVRDHEARFIEIQAP
jgi:ferrous iron transport protein A